MKRSPLRGRALIAGEIVVLLGLFAVLWLGFRGSIARAELDAAEPLAATAQKALLDGDAPLARASLRDLVRHTSTALSMTSDPIYRLAETLPWAGPNFTASGQAVVSVDRMAKGLAPLTSIAGTLSLRSLAPVNGTVDLENLITTTPALTAAEGAIDSARRSIRAIDTSGTLPAVAAAITRLQGITDDAASQIAAISHTAQLLPKMLGADGPRNYLIIFQNNAEVRASGGLPGALAVLHTDQGHFEMTTQTSARSFPYFDRPVLPLDYATESLYGSNVARRMQNVTLTPDFPTSARFATEMWRRQYGVALDGVIAVDPVVLSYILKATGTVKLDTGDTLSSKTAIKFLLSGVYTKYPDNEQQDEVFADAARKIFAALSSNSVDPSELLTQVTRGAGERRILLWNSREPEQRLISNSDFAGELPSTNIGATVIGVFLNDATGAKLGYYLDATSSLKVKTCRGESSPIYRTTVTLSSSAPADAATSLAPAIIGPGKYGVPLGTIRTRVTVYGPVGSVVGAVTQEGTQVASQPQIHMNRPVAQIIIDLAPGQSQTTTVDMIGAINPSPDAILRMTPMLRKKDAVSVAPHCN